MSRSVGIKRDLRQSKLETYANYYYLNFRSYIGQHGDCYDRFLIRMNEMSESLNIINQVINKISIFNNIKNSTSMYDIDSISNKEDGINQPSKFTNYTSTLPHNILNYTLPNF
jgi:NADH:ubiquinone oxidoreductase subunit D